MKAGVLVAATALASCATLLRAAYTPPNPAPAAAPAGTYAIEPHHTQLAFTVWHLGLTRYSGLFPTVAGTLAWNPANPAAMAVDIHVPTAAVRTTSADLDKRLRGPDWLDAQHFPEMRFQSRTVTPTGPADATIAGDLTLHGETHPLTMAAHFNGSAINPFGGKRDLGFTLTGALRRSQWGVRNSIPFVSDEVQLTIAAAFEKA